MGVDRGDPVLDDRCGRAAIDRIFSNAEIAVAQILVGIPPLQQQGSRALPATGQVCHVWRELAQVAWNEGASFTILLGDDVRLLSPDWASEIKREFRELHASAFQHDEAATSPRGSRTLHKHGGAAVSRLEGIEGPVGFGVVCFKDDRSPGFPGFPVLHRTHREIFPEIIPTAFVNQDADPWIFQVLQHNRCVRTARSGRARVLRSICVCVPYLALGVGSVLSMGW